MSAHHKLSTHRLAAHRHTTTIFQLLYFLPPLLLTLPGPTVATYNCTLEQYYSVKTKSCVLCTKCSTNESEVDPCTGVSDTKCRHWLSILFKTNLPQKISNKTARKLAVTPRAPASVAESDTVKGSGSSDYWENLAYLSVGIVVFLMIVASLSVGYVWIKWRANQKLKMRVNEIKDFNSVVGARLESFRCRWVTTDYSSVATDDYDASDLYYSHSAMRLNQRLCRAYRPQRRILDTHEDDVFESASDTAVEIPPTKNTRLDDLSIPPSDDDNSRPVSHVFMDILHVSETNSRPCSGQFFRYSDKNLNRNFLGDDLRKKSDSPTDKMSTNESNHKFQNSDLRILPPDNNAQGDRRLKLPRSVHNADDNATSLEILAQNEPVLESVNLSSLNIADNFDDISKDVSDDVNNVNVCVHYGFNGVNSLDNVKGTNNVSNTTQNGGICNQSNISDHFVKNHINDVNNSPNSANGCNSPDKFITFYNIQPDT